MVAPSHNTEPWDFIQRVHGVRYQVKDVPRSVAFYTQQLGFTLEHQHLPAFASISLGDAQILLSGPPPQARGQCQMANARAGRLESGCTESDGSSGCIAELKKGGVHFRNEMETGPGGRQIQIEDPDGNPIELFEPAR
jgi:glyoxylase I family protein